MIKSFFILAISFLFLLILNISWIVINLYSWVIDGVESIIRGKNLLENIYYSIYFRWIMLANLLWLAFALVFMFGRKKFKTDSSLHYLYYEPIVNPSITMVIPAFNEELSIGKVVEDFKQQRYVKSIIVVDNNSTDNTVKIAKDTGVKVITKTENKGYSHSLVLGLKEALKTDCNVIGVTEADGTYNSYDIEKMIPYLDNTDMVIGTRQNQTITEKGNQNSMLHVWGNFFLGKLIQLKYFNLHYTGIVNLTDVGCVYRLMKKNALEKVINNLTQLGSDKPIGGIGIGLYLTMTTIENDLRIIEIPVTFNKRIGLSKIESNKFPKAMKVGLKFLWLIVTC